MSNRTSCAARAVDLAIEPAARVGVAVEATDVALQGREFIESFRNNTKDTVLVVVGDKLLGLLGLLDLSVNDPLDGEEDEVCVCKKIPEHLEVVSLVPLVDKILAHAWAGQQPL